MILSMITTIVVICSVCLTPTQMYAENTYSGPERDPVIIHSNVLQASLMCPELITVSCDDLNIYSSFAEFELAGGMLIDQDPNCVVDSFSHVEDVIINQSGCTTLYSREYYVEDSCDNTYTCSQPIMLTDNGNPVLMDCPMNTTIALESGCDTAFVVPIVTATDGCGNATVSNDAPAIFNAGTTTVTYTATDDCGNTATCSFDVTVEIEMELLVTCPPAASTTAVCSASDVLAYATYAEFSTAGGSVSSACGPIGSNFTLALTGTNITGTCPQMVTYTYTITDENGNTGSCDQTTSVNDIGDPSFTIPADITVDCGIEGDTSVTGVPAMIMDDCDVMPSITFADGVPTIGMCPGEKTIVRTWTVTDACDNSFSDDQTIMTIDTTDPIAMCVDTLVVYLDILGDAAIVPSEMNDNSSDECGTISFSTTMSIVSCNQLAGNVLGTLDVEDECGNMSSCGLIIKILDTLSVDLIAPASTTITCIEDLPDPYIDFDEYQLGGGTVDDNCLTGNSFTLLSADTTGVCPKFVYRTYEYVDFSGNSDTAIDTIIIEDNDDPVIICPADINVTETMYCDTLLIFGTPGIMDNCDGVIITNDYTNNSDTSAIFEGGQTIITFTATDLCGNTAECSMTINVAADPQITFPPLGSINSEEDLPDFEDLQAFLDAGGMINTYCAFVDSTFMYEPDFDIQSDGCTAIITQTVTISDTLGNITTAQDTTEIMDDQNPVLSGCIPMFLMLDPVTCSFSTALDTPTVTDNFGVDTVYAVVSDVVDDEGTVKWYATDLCGNIDSCTVDVFIFDGTSPDFLISDTTVMCDPAMAPIYNTIEEFLTGPDALVFDCRLDSTSFMFVGSTIDANGNMVNTYSIDDLSGNNNTTTQTIFVLDSTAPMFDAPVDVTIDCFISVDSLEITGTVDSMLLDDNCMDIDTLIYIDNVTNLTCPNIQNIERIWILTDNTGNETRDTQIIVTQDTIAPIFDKSPDAIADINCDDPLPAVETLTATDDCTTAIVTVDTSTTIGNSCSGYMITYVYSATDICGNVTQDSVQFQRLPDITKPQLVDLNNQSLDTDLGLCGALVDGVPAPIFTEDCSQITMVNNFTDTIYPLGTTLVTWDVSNNCGLDTSVVQEIVVADNEPPSILCKDLNISLGGDGLAIVQADTLATQITDNCDHYFGNSTKVRRIDGPSECTNDGTFGNSVTFCCDDIGKTILVEVQVTDDEGNANTCTSEINVSNNSGINIEQGLPFINISCEFLFDPEDLSIFGSFVDDIADQENIIIEDTNYVNQNFVAGLDGVYSNVCNQVIISETSETLTGSCGRDTIIRSFKFKNGNDSLTYQQFIYRSDYTLFGIDGISWPEDFEWNQCANPAPDTSIAGAPILTFDYCSQVGMSFTDELFNYPLTSCPFIKRKWKVIDWCQYDSSVDPNPGEWTYNQFINIENDVPPTILSTCADTLICAPGSACEATVSLSIEAEDDCAADAQNLYYEYRIDIGNDNLPGNDITGSTSSFSLPIESGIHNVLWFVEDRCGNIAECDYLITVKECKDPTPVCLTGLALSLGGNDTVELWASDINQSSNDNCTAEEDLLLSFSSDPTEFGITFTIADVGVQPIELWVTDEAGNQAYCSTTVEIQNNNIISNDPNNSLEGKITTENQIAIEEAMVSIIGAEMDSEFMTDTDGEYAFLNLDSNNEYQVTVEKDKDPMVGVSTLDLVMIQRHILGLENLDSPYKLIAADVNNSEGLTASDLLALRKVILGIDETFEDNTSWRFVSMDQEMSDIENPWLLNEDLILQNGNISALESDFVGIKIGDVNNSVDGLIGPNQSTPRSQNSLGLFTKDQKISRDGQVLIDVFSSEDIDLSALQMTITWDVEAMSLVDILSIGIEMETNQYSTHLAEEGKLTIAWHASESQNVNEGLPIFQLIMEGNKSRILSDVLTINSEITDAIAYDKNHESLDIELLFGESAIEGIHLHQNKPNPFSTETLIEFSLPEAMDVTFKIFDGSGRLIFQENSDYPEGENVLILNDQIGEYKGILFLKMEAAEFSEVKRMIKIE